MRRYPRLDTSQKAIKEAFEQMGYSVLSLASVGSGCPDLLVAKGFHAFLIECKTPKHGTKPETLEKQTKFRQNWKGAVSIVRDLEGVATVVRMLRGESR